MPVMVFFSYGGKVSIAIINRRRNQIHQDRDVLGKVTLMQDIDVFEPHRGHLQILESFSADVLRRDQTVDSFDSLHAAWEKALSVELLNKRFYLELSNWYFWASGKVEFPDDIEKDQETRNATSLIRLITRLIFCWFLKEKGLIPKDLFEEEKLETVLIDMKKGESSTFYQAILQNLFFATLNQRMNTDQEAHRKFAQDADLHTNKKEYGVKNIYRYRDQFQDVGRALDLFRDIPFLNGGLFECLDREDEEGRVQYLDGFSRNPKKQSKVPDYLFFGDEQVVDLNKFFQENNKRGKKQKVRGLIHILSDYKFTIVENTPIEQETALDPELLGLVFENLLALYNPETKTTARKKTGSFYTPRPVVDYMVTESLKMHLTTALTETGMAEKRTQTKLKALFAYAEHGHGLKEAEVDTLLGAIHTCKILDPACGSGAFPMGMLQRLVFVIQKLDPNNSKWKKLQIDKAKEIPDSSARKAAIDAIEKDFADNEDGYGRKLYLIENCLYGVDIQPIAIQISKLRFFISLICDQKTNRNNTENRGIRPLPNLETKFVVADTLISLGITRQLDVLVDNDKVKEIEEKLQRVRHDHFTADKRERRLELQREDREHRDDLAEALKEGGAEEIIRRKLADWNPYDPQESADFFEPRWMFDKTVKDGFDVVIGNPPYMRIQGIRQVSPIAADYYKKHYKKSATGSFDLYVIFMERGMSLLKPNGILNYINPDKWVNAAFGKGIRGYSVENKSVHRLISFGAHKVFSAHTYSSLLWMGKKPTDSIRLARLDPDVSKLILIDEELDKLSDQGFTSIPFDSLTDRPWILIAGDAAEAAMDAIQRSSRTVSDIFSNIFQGIASSKDSVYFLKRAEDCGSFFKAYSDELDEVIKIEKWLVKPLLYGEQVHRYECLGTDNVVVFPYDLGNDDLPATRSLMTAGDIQTKFPMGWEYLERCEEALRSRESGRLSNDNNWYRYIYPKNLRLFRLPKLLAPDISFGGNFSIDEIGKFYTTTTLYGYIKRPHIRESYKFLLAVLNSKVLWFYVKNSGSVLAKGYYRYTPGYLKNFPIPEVSDSKQEPFIRLVDQTLQAKADNGNADTSEQEAEIDKLVYELYGLTAEEITIIEEKSRA